MIWGNQWAWAGLAFLVLPVVIHLLGRGDARRRVFPTLRFLPASRSLPTRRRRIRDPLLLAVRVGILGAATIALAQPYFVTENRRRDSNRGIARAIIVDTSESMRRAGAAGVRPIDRARAGAEQLAREAQTSLVIQTAKPRRAIAGAVSWIARQQRRAELVVVSDFQVGTVDARDLALVPAGVGIRLSRVDAVPRSDVPTRAADVAANVILLAGATERSGAEAAQRAASFLGTRHPADSSRLVAIVYPGYERRAEVLKNATPLRTPWMTSVVARLRSDSMLIGSATDAAVSISSAADTTGGLAVARTDAGVNAVTAVQGRVEGRDGLLLVAFIDASSLTSAALIAGATRALSEGAPPTEMEPEAVVDSELRSWQREPDARVTQHGTDGIGSDGRWLWMFALALLAIETWLRRARREEVVVNLVHDRAA